MLQCQLQDTHPKVLQEFHRILRVLTSESEDADQSPGSDSFSLSENLKQLPTNIENHIRTWSQGSSDIIVGNHTPTKRILRADEPPRTAMRSIAFENFENITPNETPIIQAVDTVIEIDHISTYSHLESSFTRRLKRVSLEHAFRIFTDPHSNPYEVFQLFRLVPCFRERGKMYPYFKNLVTSDRSHPLEIFSLPFYGIGGAGTHYPDLNEAGDPISPPKMRLPRRILGILPIERSDILEDMHQAQPNILELCGFGGDWFDCRDVEGYLREKGVDMDDSTVFPTIKIPKIGKSTRMIGKRCVGLTDCRCPIFEPFQAIQNPRS